MAEKSRGQSSGSSNTTDDSKSPSKKKASKGEKGTSAKQAPLTSKRLTQLEKKLEEAQEKKKKEEARLRKIRNREKTALKKKERDARNGRLIAMGIAFEIEEEKDPKVYDMVTDLLNKHLTERHVRARFEGRIPPLHRTDKGEDLQDNKKKNPKEEFKETA